MQLAEEIIASYGDAALYINWKPITADCFCVICLDALANSAQSSLGLVEVWIC